MGRRPCCSKEGINRGAWTAIEDKTLSNYIKLHGEGKWRNLPKRAGLKRCGKSCRLRWLNYLRPDIKRGNITTDEEDLIIRLHNLLGNRWSLIAGRLPGRTDNEIKNYWNTCISKKLKGNLNVTSNSNLKKVPSKRSPSSRIQQFRFHSSNELRAIRTKASRCTWGLYEQRFRVGSTSINKELYQNDVVGGPEPLDHEKSHFILEDPEPFDFFLDFDLDDKFLSDFLNNETIDTKTSSSFGYFHETLSLASVPTPFSDSTLDWPENYKKC